MRSEYPHRVSLWRYAARRARGVLWLLACTFLLPGCTDVKRVANLYSAHAPSPSTFRFGDGGSTLYYQMSIGDVLRQDTLVFLYGGTGCTSWKTVLPDYIEGLSFNAGVFVLNKRFVNDRATGLFPCGRDFDRANNPVQWVKDYSEFIQAQVARMHKPPQHVVLIGVSEGAVPAVQTAALLPVVTHLAIIGSGAFTLRQSLATLHARGAIGFDIANGAKKMAEDPKSIDRTWYGNPYRWWSDLLDVDLMPQLLALDIPILVGVGQRDESMPMESAIALRAAFDAAGKSNLKVEIYPDADHRLAAKATNYRPTFFAELSKLVRR